MSNEVAIRIENLGKPSPRYATMLFWGQLIRYKYGAAASVNDTLRANVGNAC